MGLNTADINVFSRLQTFFERLFLHLQ